MLPQPNPSKRWLEKLCETWRYNMLQIGAMVQPYLVREQVTHGNWVDGNPIFRKTIAITETFCETDDTDIAHGIADFGGLVAIEGRFKDGSAWHMLPYIDSSGNSISIKADATNITSMINGTPAFGTWSLGYVTLWYTKG